MNGGKSKDGAVLEHVFQRTFFQSLEGSFDEETSQ